MMLPLAHFFAAFSLLGVAGLAALRAYRQGVNVRHPLQIPELRHVIPTGAGCILGGVGFLLQAAGVDYGAWIVALGLLLVCGSLSVNIDNMISQPTTEVVNSQIKRAILDMEDRMKTRMEDVLDRLATAEKAMRAVRAEANRIGQDMRGGN